MLLGDCCVPLCADQSISGIVYERLGGEEGFRVGWGRRN